MIRVPITGMADRCLAGLAVNGAAVLCNVRQKHR